MYSDLKLRSRLLRNLELANVIPLKPGLGQNIATHASPTVSIFCFVFPFLSCRMCTKYKTEKHSMKFSNHHWDLDLEHSHPIFSQNTSAYECGSVPSIMKWSLDAKEPTVKKIQKKWSYFDYVSPWLWREDFEWFQVWHFYWSYSDWRCGRHGSERVNISF